MERFRELDRFQKGVFLLVLILPLVFAVLCFMTVSRVGYAYRSAILVPRQEAGKTVYSGTVQGQQTVFTVSENTLLLQYGSRTYGPYTVKEDPTAIPQDRDLKGSVTGLEIRRGESIFFRGAVKDSGTHMTLYHKEHFFFDTLYEETDIINVSGTDVYGNAVDPIEPSVLNILRLLGTPELTHKGSWTNWFWGTLLCVLTAVSILFREYLFRLRMSLQIQDADRAEPSGLVFGSWYVAWALLPIAALILFIIGLQ